MTSRDVFLDANGLIALLNQADQLHPQAVEVWSRLLEDGTPLVTSDWVLAETGNGLARTRARRNAATMISHLTNSRICELVFVAEGLLDESVALYVQRDDKTWGLVDCCSMVIMQKRGVREVFSNDRHFEQAGFTCLLG